MFNKLKKYISLAVLVVIVVNFNFVNNVKAATGDWKPVGDQATLPAAASYSTMVFDNNGTPYIAYIDSNGWDKTKGKVIVIKYDGANWVQVGDAGSLTTLAVHTSMVIDKNTGTLYLVYQDEADSHAVKVVKYNKSNNNWEQVGSTLKKNTAVYGYLYPSIAISSNGTPYVAYVEPLSQKMTVKKFDGTSWVGVGSEGFTPGAVNRTSITIGVDGTPYVLFGDSTKNNIATVMKFNGTTWETVGNQSISQGPAFTLHIIIDKSGTPYILFYDQNCDDKVFVKKFDGTNWITLGGGPISLEYAEEANFTLDSAGTPYAILQDGYKSQSGVVGFGGKAVVKKYDSESDTWSIIGSEGFSTGAVQSPCIGIDNNGKMYVEYSNDRTPSNMSVMTYEETSAPPTVTVNSVSNISSTGATLNGAVNANNENAIVKFEYGTTTAYGNEVAVSQSPVTGSSDIPVNADIKGLLPNTTYHYKIIATNTKGEVSSNDAIFTTLAPIQVSSVTVPNDGTYKMGDTLSFTVNFTGAVNVTGTPSLPITIGSTTRQATYSAGSGKNAITFTYTVAAGDNDNDGIAIDKAVELNGRAIVDNFGDSALLTLNYVPSTAGVIVDTTAPTFNAENGTALDTTDNKNVTLTFSEAVSAVDAATLKNDITFAADGTNFKPLAENDTVKIVNGKVVITFNNALAGINNKIEIAANSLKDTIGNIKTDIIETNSITVNQTKSYTVTFKDYDGTIISTQSVICGESAKLPQEPTRIGYVFTGWDKAYSNINGDLELTATYKSGNIYPLTPRSASNDGAETEAPIGLLRSGDNILEINNNIAKLEIPASAIDISGTSDSDHIKIIERYILDNSKIDLINRIPSGIQIVGNPLNLNVELRNSSDAFIRDIHQFANNEKIKVTIKLTSDEIKGIDTSKLTMYYYDEVNMQWVEIGGSYDTNTMEYTFYTPHFTKFAVMQKLSTTTTSSSASSSGSVLSETTTNKKTILPKTGSIFDFNIIIGIGVILITLGAMTLRKRKIN